MIRIPKLTEILDQGLRKILQNLFDDLRADTIQKCQFSHFEVNITKAETLKFRHGLNFQPKDLIITYKTGTGTYTINYDQFTTEIVSITTTGPVRLRMLVGRYE